MKAQKTFVLPIKLVLRSTLEKIGKIQFEKMKIGGIKTIIDLIVQLFPIISPLILDQFTCSLPKNVTTFHGEQDGIIHFCLSPNKRGVLAL